MKRILYIFPTLKPGGAEKAAIQIANYLVRRQSYSITFYLFDDSDYYKDLIDPNIVIIRSVNRFDRGSKMSYWYHYYVRAGIELFHFLGKEQFDFIVGIHEQIPEVISAAAKMLLWITGVKKVTQYISVIATNLSGLHKDRTHMTSRLLFVFLRWIRRSVFSSIIVLTRAMQNEMRGQSKSIVLIPNPVEIEELSRCTVKEISEMPVPGSYVIYVGRVTPQKNQLLLLQAFKEIFRSVIFDIVMIGYVNDPMYEEELKMFAATNGFSNRVHFLGAVQQPYQIIANAKALVLTSNYEGLPMSLLESMALNIPVIMTRYDGYEEYFSDDTATIVNKNSVDELSNALLSVQLNDERLSANAQRAKEYVRRFDISVIGEMYHKLFSGEVI
ncbi:MAG: glycosyltransferase [Bacteroidota bacterium]